MDTLLCTTKRWLPQEHLTVQVALYIFFKKQQKTKNKQKNNHHTHTHDHPILALLDSGSTINLAHPSVLPGPVKACETVSVTCLHGDAWEVPATKVWVGSSRSKWPLLIGLVPKIPVPLLIGKDWPGFPMELLATPKKKDGKPSRKPQSGPGQPHPTYLAQEEEDSAGAGAKGESKFWH